MALTTAPGSTRKSMGESPIHPARYHDSRGWIAATRVDNALIVACVACDCGACVINDPASEKSCASSNCTMCCASVLFACISASITTVFESEMIFCVRASSNSDIMTCAQCSFCPSNLTVYDSELILCVRVSSSSEIMSCAQCSFEFSVFTVASSVISPILESSNSW